MYKSMSEYLHIKSNNWQWFLFRFSLYYSEFTEVTFLEGKLGWFLMLVFLKSTQLALNEGQLYTMTYV